MLLRFESRLMTGLSQTQAVIARGTSHRAGGGTEAFENSVAKYDPSCRGSYGGLETRLVPREGKETAC